jgi:hypothetical protein
MVGLRRQNVENDVLSDLLELGLFRIGADDTRLELFRKAVADLARGYIKDPATAINATSAALDPNVDPDDPQLELAQMAIVAHWQTFRNAFTEPPRQLLRGVLVAALDRASEQDHRVNGVVWLTAVSRRPLIDLGRESSLVDNRLHVMAGRYARRASDRWEYEIGIPRASQTGAAARGSAHDDAEDSDDDGAPALDHAAWITEFDQLDRRTRALWWGESLYSVSARKSYREVSSSTAALLMAIDFAALVGPYHPISAEYYLRERIRATQNSRITATSGSRARRRTSAESASVETIGGIIATGTGEPDGVSQAQIGSSSESHVQGRTSLLGYIHRLLRGRASTNNVIDGALGLPGSHSMNVSDVGVWLFRDLLAASLAKQPSAEDPSTRSASPT